MSPYEDWNKVETGVYERPDHKWKATYESRGWVLWARLNACVVEFVATCSTLQGCKAEAWARDGRLA